MPLNLDAFIESLSGVGNLFQRVLMEKYQREQEMRDWKTRTHEEDELLRKRQEEADARQLAGQKEMFGEQKNFQTQMADREDFSKRFGPNPALRMLAGKAAIPTNFQDQMSLTSYNDIARSIANREELTPQQVEAMRSLDPTLQADLMQKHQEMKDVLWQKGQAEESLGLQKQRAADFRNYRAQETERKELMGKITKIQNAQRMRQAEAAAMSKARATAVQDLESIDKELDDLEVKYNTVLNEVADAMEQGKDKYTDTFVAKTEAQKKAIINRTKVLAEKKKKIKALLSPEDEETGTFTGIGETIDKFLNPNRKKVTGKPDLTSEEQAALDELLEKLNSKDPNDLYEAILMYDQ